MRFALDRRATHIRLQGVARVDRKTKNLIKRLHPNEIAIINHTDLDEVAADGLIAARVKAVINTAPSISGRYPNLGPLKLVKAGIPLLDVPAPDLMTRIHEGSTITLIDNLVVQTDIVLSRGTLLTEERVLSHMARAMMNVPAELKHFVENTLTYANQEKTFFLNDLPTLDLRTKIKGRHVLVVVRGPSYKEDLRAIFTYIRDMKPVLIGVDGGADALIEAGLTPDLIVGDMDSVSDGALRSSAERIVHAFPDGRAPGLDRIKALHLTAHTYPAPGTSEDIAMLLAHEKGAELIVALGTHSNMIDFLEKGRPGMSSTVLTRMRIGNKLVDAKGVSLLYRRTVVDWRAAGLLILSAMVPIGIVAWLNPVTRSFLRLVYLKLKYILF